MTSQHTDMAALMRRLLAAGGPRSWVANAPWPLHQAVAESCEVLCPGLAIKPAAGLGRKVPGLNEAVLRLEQEGTIELRDEGFISWWVLVEEAQLRNRRELFRCDPSVAHAHHLAAVRWAALARTSEKTLRRAGPSPDGMSRLVAPTLRQPKVPAR